MTGFCTESITTVPTLGKAAVHSREKEIIEASSVFVHPRVLRNCNWWLSLLLCYFAGNDKRSFRGGPTHSGALYCMVTIRRLCPPHKDQHTLAEPKTEPRQWGGGGEGNRGATGTGLGGGGPRGSQPAAPPGSPPGSPRPTPPVGSRLPAQGQAAARWVSGSASHLAVAA